MRPTALEIARGNARYELQRTLEVLDARSFQDTPRLLGEIAARYHVLGLAALLEDADREAFVFLLALSGQTYCHLLSLDLSNHPRERAPSRGLSFLDALAAGDLETARAIVQLSVRAHVEGYEYEDDFLAFHFMHRLLLDPGTDDTFRPLLSRWTEVVDGGPAPMLPVARALVDRDEAALDEAFVSLAAARRKELEAWRSTPRYQEDIAATEAAIFVKGLALLRLAELRKLRTADEYDFMPEAARVRLGLRLPMAGAWRQGEPPHLSP